jgi:hypothetical protein
MIYSVEKSRILVLNLGVALSHLTVLQWLNQQNRGELTNMGRVWGTVQNFIFAPLLPLKI